MFQDLLMSTNICTFSKRLFKEHSIEVSDKDIFPFLFGFYSVMFGLSKKKLLYSYSNMVLCYINLCEDFLISTKITLCKKLHTTQGSFTPISNFKPQYFWIIKLWRSANEIAFLVLVAIFTKSPNETILQTMFLF